MCNLAVCMCVCFLLNNPCFPGRRPTPVRNKPDRKRRDARTFALVPLTLPYSITLFYYCFCYLLFFYSKKNYINVTPALFGPPFHFPSVPAHPARTKLFSNSLSLCRALSPVARSLSITNQPTEDTVVTLLQTPFHLRFTCSRTDPRGAWCCPCGFRAASCTCPAPGGRSRGGSCRWPSPSCRPARGPGLA